MSLLDVFRGKQKVHIASLPTARTLYRFQALESFESEEFRSAYSKHGIYHVREGNDRLHTAVLSWESEGKVRRL